MEFILFEEAIIFIASVTLGFVILTIPIAYLYALALF